MGGSDALLSSHREGRQCGDGDRSIIALITLINPNSPDSPDNPDSPASSNNPMFIRDIAPNNCTNPFGEACLVVQYKHGGCRQLETHLDRKRERERGRERGDKM